MPLILLTLFLGLITYWVISRRAARMTRVPIWLLWLVMMMPLIVLTLWVVATGEEPPALLTYGLLILCPLVYAVMVLAKAQASRPIAETKAPEDASQSASQSATKSATKPITRDEEALLQRCFPWSTYYLQDIEYRPQAMICKGKLKTSPAEAYQTVQKNVESSFGDRFLVLFQEGLNGMPFFALVPNPQAKITAETFSRAQAERIRRLKRSPVTRPGLALALALITLVTTTLAGMALVSGAVEEPQRLQIDPTLWRQGLAYALSLMLILGVHESGHYLATRFHGLKATLPYFIPVPFFLGTFGAFIQMRSPMPNRKALFDVGISGPLAGLVVSLPIVLWGLAQSTLVPLSEQSQLFTFEALDPKRSLAVFLLAKLALGSALTAGSALKLHPVAISGCLGLIVTALNLMPVGQLDGGHVVHAMYGQRTAAIVSQVARLLMLLMSFVYSEFFLWAVLLLFIPAAEPALNDVSELNGSRDLLGLLSLAMLLMIILPAPSALIQLLG